MGIPYSPLRPAEPPYWGRVIIFHCLLMSVLSSCIASITRILIPNRNSGSQRVVSTGAILDVVMVPFVKATASALL